MRGGRERETAEGRKKNRREEVDEEENEKFRPTFFDRVEGVFLFSSNAFFRLLFLFLSLSPLSFSLSLSRESDQQQQVRVEGGSQLEHANRASSKRRGIENDNTSLIFRLLKKRERGKRLLLLLPPQPLRFT